MVALPLSYFLLIFTLASTIDTVNGHGFVHSVVINGQSYPGWNPFSDPYNNSPVRVVRKVLSDGFVAATDVDLGCHHGGNDGTSAVADVAAGSQVTFQWSYWPSDHQGPVSTYMTSCDGDCTTFSAAGARWFKLDAAGYYGADRQWAADKLRENNNSWVSTVPAELAPGQYLIRNEIIALHSGDPQFYPSCSQVRVTGSGAGKPSEQELVSIPGLYTGIKFPNIYTSSDVGSFSIPGPQPVTFGNNGVASSSLPSTVTSPSPTAGVGTSTNSQQITNVSTAAPVATIHPSDHCLLTSRRLIRRRSIMRRH